MFLFELVAVEFYCACVADKLGVGDGEAVIWVGGGCAGEAVYPAGVYSRFCVEVSVRCCLVRKK